MADHERVEITSAAELRAWLQEHHTQRESIWLVTYKKSARPDLHVPWPDIVREALCFGWIDSQAAKLDDERRMLRLSPRKRGSMWSAINKAHVADLAERGQMTDAGWAAIERAKADGSWEFLDDIDAMIVPADLDEAFRGAPGARDHFESFPPSTRKSTLAWIKMAKRPETRAKRIAETVQKCAEGQRPV